MDILGQSSLLVGVTSFALGFSILARNVKNKLFIAFSVLTTLISAWALCFFMNKVWEGGAFYRWHMICNVWLAPAGLAFIHVMVRIQDTVSKRLRDVAFLGAMGLSIVELLGLENSNPYARELINFIPGLVILQILQL